MWLAGSRPPLRRDSLGSGDIGIAWGAIMECPACSNPMEPLQVGALALDRCPHCGVVWFDARELKQFLSLVRSLPPSADTAAPPTQAMECPRCQAQPLDRAHWRGIPLAFCDTCSGILLTDSALGAVRSIWARMVSRRAPQFQLPLPEGWDDTEQMFVETLVGGLMGLL